MNKKCIIGIILLMLLCAIGFAQSIKVEYMCGDEGFDSDSQIKPHFQIINEGRHRVNLNQLTLHYYYTKEGWSHEKFHVEYAKIGKKYVKGSFRKDYVKISFPGAGLLNPGDSTGPIEIRINKRDWSNYNEKDDYSYGKHFNYKSWEKVTCYYYGKRVWGVEPGSEKPEKTPKPVVTDGPTNVPTPTVVPGIYGDVNDDGVVNIVDALMICQVYTGLHISGILLNMTMADVNLDGEIDLRDVLLIIQYYVGLTTNISSPIKPPVDYDSYYTVNEGQLGLSIIDKIYSGGTGSIGVELTPGRKAIAGYRLKLFYDPAFLALDPSEGIGGVVANEGYVMSVNATEPGVIIMAGFDVLGVESDGTLDFMKVLFKGLALGTTNVRVEVDALIDQYGLPIGETQIEYLDVEIATPYNPTPYVSPKPSASPETREGSVVLFPELTEVLPGENFSIGCQVDSGKQLLAAYTFSISYDATVIAANNSVGINSVTIGADGFLAAVSSKPGQIRVAGFDVVGIGPGNDLHLLNLNFIALSEGETDINLVIDDMVNPIYQQIGKKLGVGCSVIVKTDGPISHEPGEFWFKPSTLSLTSGNTFDTGIHLDSGDKIVAAYSIVIEFDEEILIPDFDFGDKGVMAGSDGYLTAVNVENGKVKIAGFSLSKVVGDDLDFLNIRWIAKKQGFTELIIGSPVLSTPDYQTIGTPSGDSMKIYILSEDLDNPGTPDPGLTVTTTPSPTPTPEPEPTKTPVINPELEPGTVILEPSEKKVDIGDNFALKCNVVTGDQFLAAYTLNFSFDPEILELDKSIGEDGIVIAPDGFMAAYRVSEGLLVVSGFDVNGKGSESKFHLLDLNFSAVGPGKSEVAVEVKTLADYKTDILGTPKGIGAMVYVGDPGVITEVGHVWFSPSEICLTENKEFQTEVHVNTGIESLGAFGFDIKYDPSLVYPDLSIGKDGVICRDEFFISANADYKRGLLRIGGHKSEPMVLTIGKDLNLLTINWVARSNGLTNLEMSVPVLVADSTKTIGTPRGDSMSIKIDVPDFEPTPTPDLPVSKPGTVFLAPVVQRAETGDIVKLQCGVITGDQVLAAYGLEISFDPEKLALDKSFGRDGIVVAPEGFMTAYRIDDGLIVISGFDVDGSGTPPKLHLLDLFFSALTEGETVVEMKAKSLIDANVKPIGTPVGEGAVVFISKKPGETFVGEARFEPSEINITCDTAFQTDVYLNLGAHDLGAFDVTIEYDPEMVYPDTKIGVSGVSGLEEFVIAANPEFKKPGVLKIAGYKVKHDIVVSGKNVHLLTVNWVVKSNGTSDLLMTVPVLNSDKYETIGTPTGDTIKVNINIPEPTVTPDPRAGLVWLSGDNSPYYRLGDSFEVTVNVNTGSQVVAAYGIKVLYDESIIIPDLSVGDKGVTAGAEGYVSAVNSKPGELIISGFDPLEYQVDEKLELINIAWKAVGVGSSPLKILIDKLVDQQYKPVGNPHTALSDPSVTILDAIVEGPGNVFFVPKEVKLTEGTKFQTEVHVNTGDQSLGAFGFDIIYDPSVVYPDISIGDDGVRVRDEFIVSANANFKPGFLRIGGSKTKTKVITSGEDLNLLTIDWVARSNGACELKMAVPILVADSTEIIGTPKGDSMAIIIDTPDLMKTPTPTPEPTPVDRVGKLWFFGDLPPRISVGDSFKLTLNVNTGKQVLAAYGIKVLYDDTVMTPESSIGDKGVAAGRDGYVTAVKSNPGELVISGFNVKEDKPSSQYQLIDINWKAIGLGASTIKVVIDDLVDPVYETIGTPHAVPFTIEVRPQFNNEGVGKINFVPSSVKLTKGNKFHTELHLNAGTYNLGAYELLISYDSDAVVPDVQYEGHGVVNQRNEMSVAANPVFKPGVLKIGAFKMDFDVTTTGSDIHLLTINWIAKANSTSKIDMDVSVLVSEKYEDVGVPRGDTIPVVIDSVDLIVDPDNGTRPGAVWMTHQEDSLKVGEYVRGIVHVNTGAQILAAYQIRIFYNPEVLSIENNFGLNGVMAGSDGYVTAVKSMPGELVINGVDALAAKVSTDYKLLNINWKIIGVGKSEVKIEIDDLIDQRYKDVGIPHSLPSVILIEPEITNEKQIGQVWFDNYYAYPAINSSFTTEIHLNTGTDQLGAYLFEIRYDPSIISVDVTKGNYGVVPGTEGFVAAVNTNKPGVLRFSGFKALGAGPSKDLHLVTVNWRALSAPYTDVEIFVESLISLSYTDIGNPQGETIKIMPSYVE